MEKFKRAIKEMLFAVIITAIVCWTIQAIMDYKPIHENSEQPAIKIRLDGPIVCLDVNAN